MSFDPESHHRRSIRLRGYDYSQTGAYFVTICVQDHATLFGRIGGNEMLLNDAGRMVASCWDELRRKFSSCEPGEFVVMPNHVHGIIVILDEPSVDAHEGGGHTGPPLRIGGRPSLGRIVQWFKTMTTNAYIRGVDEHGWTPFTERLWQRNYYEHIVRDEEDLARIREYIENNPRMWKDDPENRPTKRRV